MRERHVRPSLESRNTPPAAASPTASKREPVQTTSWNCAPATATWEATGRQAPVAAGGRLTLGAEEDEALGVADGPTGIVGEATGVVGADVVPGIVADGAFELELGLDSVPVVQPARARTTTRPRSGRRVRPGVSIDLPTNSMNTQ